MTTRYPHFAHCRRRISRGALLTVALALAAATSTIATQAAGTYIPARFYPAGAHISYQASVSNHDLDCNWGFFCEGPVPLFHFQRQDQMHRLSGWAQFARWRQGKHQMGFELFASRYDTGTDSNNLAWSQVAFDDLLVATQSKYYAPLKHVPSLLPSGSAGGWVVELQRWGKQDLVVMACWTGSLEVEALVVFDHGSASVERIALQDLRQQVETSLR